VNDTKGEARTAVKATPALLTIPEVAEELRCCVATVYREIAAGTLPTRKIRRKRFVHRADLTAYLEAARQTDRPEAEVPAPKTTPRRVDLKDSGLIGDDDFGPRPKGGRKAP
jgi:excisionase family DNA binding protein